MMKYLLRIKTIILIIIYSMILHAQQTVTDYDGNIYNTVEIGKQTWIKENLKSVHYSDGTSIPDVAAYNNSDSLANIYGLLYSWYAAMHDSTEEGVQGVCPCGWYIPTNRDWTRLENYLGGPSVAGGKMKEEGTEHWFPPNTGSTNSSGFTAIAAGEFYINIFQFMKEYALFWSSTEVSSTVARERFLAYNDDACFTYDWNKSAKYPIRCIKNSVTSIENESLGVKEFELFQNYPNPFNPTTSISFQIPSSSSVTLKVYDVLGNEISTLVSEEKPAGSYKVEFYANKLNAGFYFYQLKTENYIETKKMVLLK